LPRQKLFVKIQPNKLGLTGLSQNCHSEAEPRNLTAIAVILRVIPKDLSGWDPSAIASGRHCVSDSSPAGSEWQ